MAFGRAAFFTNIQRKNYSDNAPYDFPKRTGAEYDKDSFQFLFWNTLGLKPLISSTTEVQLEDKKNSSVENLTMEEWRGWEKRLKSIDFSKSKYVLLAFSSHGNESISESGKREPCVILSDGKRLPLSDIMKALDTNNLKNKPKIVMLLTCRVFPKPAETFDFPLEPTNVTDYQLGSETLQLKRVSPTYFILTWDKKVEKKDYQIIWTTQESNKEWTVAQCLEGTLDVDGSTIDEYRMTGLKPDTTYCVSVTKGNQTDLKPWSEPMFARTLPAEDEGVDLPVELDQSPPKGKHTGGGDEDDMPPKQMGRFKVQQVTDIPVTEELQTAGDIPNDFLIVYGATRGQNAKRDIEKGGWVMTGLRDVVDKEDFDKDLNLFHLLTKTAQQMANRETEHASEPSSRGKKSMLCFSHTLTESIMVKKTQQQATPSL